MSWKDEASGLQPESAFNGNAAHLKLRSHLYLTVDCNTQEISEIKKESQRSSEPKQVQR